MDELLRRVADLLASNQPARAIEMLRHEPRIDRTTNALGVCFLRNNHPEDALKYFKELVLSPGSVWPRADAHDTYKTNYATALLMVGHPAGAKAALSTLKQPDATPARQLREALKAWADKLPLRARLAWKLGQIEPEGYPISLSFPPGELV